MSATAATGLLVATTGAFEKLKAQLSITSERDLAGRRFICGAYQGRSIVLVRSPMGKVNNAITTQILLSQFEIDSVISIAPAGAVSNEVEPGDIVLADLVYQHDFGTIKPYGFIWGKAPDGKGWEDAGYHAHPDSSVLVMQRLKEEKLAKVFIGSVVSGDQLIASREKRDWLNQKFRALVVDMSAAAIVQTCFANMTPCRIIRVVTDHADESARSDFEDSLSSGPRTLDYRILFQTLMTLKS